MSVRFRKIFLLFFVWLAVIILSLAGSFFNSVLFDIPFHLKQELPFLARWVTWFAITPFAINLAKNVNYSNNKLSRFLLYHFSIYILITVVHTMLASALASFITTMLHGTVQYREILIKCALTGVFYNFIVYTIIVLLQNGLQYYKALQEEKTKTLSLEKSLSDTRLQFLKQQLQPHFLFNTHHSIITLMKLGEKEKATAMLEKLSELMRIALRESNEQTVPLGREIEMLQLYLDIQKIRFEDKLDVAYELENGLNAASVPGMLLQPLVENSIKYAVENSVGRTKITISAHRENGSLLLSVKDELENSNTHVDIQKGVGLSNAEERLHKLYGNNYKFIFAPYRNNGHGGVEVKISIPFTV